MNSILFLLLIIFVEFGGIEGEPSVGDVFGVDLEVNVYSDYPNGRAASSLVNLDYDKYRNQIALKILAEGNVESVIIDFNSSQIFRIAHFENKYECQSDKCTNDADSVCRREIDGLFPQLGQFDFSFGQIFPGLEILGQIPNQPFTAAGSDQWENITVDKWTTVFKDTTTTSHWTTSNWVTPNDPKWGAIPILMQTELKLQENDTTKRMQQVVPIYYEPRQKSDDETFQPKEGVFCSDWPITNAKEFPNKFDSKVFEFVSEGTKENDPIVSWSREWFDLDNGLIRIDYVSSIANSSVTKIIDYTENLIFEIGQNGCKSSARDLNMEILDSPSIVNLLKPMTSTNDFFGNAQYKYTGRRHSTRNTDNLVWQGISSDLIGNTQIETLWEWYFDKANFELGKYVPTRRSYKLVSVNESSGDDGIKIKSGDKIIHQIYGFVYSSREKLSDNFDAVSCYDSSVIRHLQFEIQNKSNGAINEIILTSKFRYEWRQILASEMRMSQLRISGTKGLIMNDKSLVQFKLLNPKSDAMETMEKRIKDGVLHVQWTDENSREWSFAAVPDTLSTVIIESCDVKPTSEPTTTIPVNEKSEFRSKGLATGVGLGCFMFGFGFGLIAAYLLRFKLLQLLFKL